MTTVRTALDDYLVGQQVSPREGFWACLRYARRCCPSKRIIFVRCREAVLHSERLGLTSSITRSAWLRGEAAVCHSPATMCAWISRVRAWLASSRCNALGCERNDQVGLIALALEQQPDLLKKLGETLGLRAVLLEQARDLLSLSVVLLE